MEFCTEHHFTGKEHDFESGNDYFGARYYSSTYGRFLSPDWSAIPDAVPYADLTDPHSLNLYGYVYNSPLTNLDFNGHGCLDNAGTVISDVSASDDEEETMVVSGSCDPIGLPPALSSTLQQIQPKPQTSSYAPAPNKSDPCSGTRTTSALHGALDLGLGVAKIGLGVLAASETGGLSLYAAYSGLSNLVSGGAELYGGVSGNFAGGERVANYAASVGSVSGLVTLGITGNAEYGANASAIEGLATVGVTGGLVSTGAMEAPGLADNAVTALDNGAGAAGLIGIGGCRD